MQHLGGSIELVSGEEQEKGQIGWEVGWVREKQIPAMLGMTKLKGNWLEEARSAGPVPRKA